MIAHTNEVVVLVGGVLSIVGLLWGGWLKWGRPKAQRAEAMSEAMLGRAEVRDRSGALIQPAQPGMPAQVAELTDAVRELVQMQHRVDGVEAQLAAVDGRVKVLEDARMEHVVSRAESAAAYSAIEAAVNATPPDC